MNQGPGYYGDLDEEDGTLLQFERGAEEEEWQEAYSDIREALGLSSDAPIPKLPRSDPSAAMPLAQPSETSAATKRKTTDDGDVEMSAPDEESKRSKPLASPTAAVTNGSDQGLIHAQAAAAYIPFLRTENLLPPKMPTREEMETVLLVLRKKALMEEYFGEGAQ